MQDGATIAAISTAVSSAGIGGSYIQIEEKEEIKRAEVSYDTLWFYRG